MRARCEVEGHYHKKEAWTGKKRRDHIQGLGLGLVTRGAGSIEMCPEPYARDCAEPHYHSEHQLRPQADPPVEDTPCGNTTHLTVPFVAKTKEGVTSRALARREDWSELRVENKIRKGYTDMLNNQDGTSAVMSDCGLSLLALLNYTQTFRMVNPNEPPKEIEEVEDKKELNIYATETVRIYHDLAYEKSLMGTIKDFVLNPISHPEFPKEDGRVTQSGHITVVPAARKIWRFPGTVKAGAATEMDMNGNRYNAYEEREIYVELLRELQVKAWDRSDSRDGQVNINTSNYVDHFLRHHPDIVALNEYETPAGSRGWDVLKATKLHYLQQILTNATNESSALKTTGVSKNHRRGGLPTPR